MDELKELRKIIKERDLEIEQLKNFAMKMAEEKDNYEELLAVSSQLLVSNEYNIEDSIVYAKELIKECRLETISKKP